MSLFWIIFACNSSVEPILSETIPIPGSAPLRRLTDQQYTNSIFDLLHVRLPAEMQPKTTKDRSYRTWMANNRVSTAGAETLLLAAEYAVQNADIDTLAGCDTSNLECASEFLLHFAYQAYRMPLSSTEKENLLRYLHVGLAPQDGLKLALILVLQSPSFLYIDGFSPTEEPTILSDYSIASRVALFLHNRSPSKELLTAAQEGKLHTLDQIEHIAQQMVQQPAFLETLKNFHYDWLDLYRLETALKDPELYPDVSASFIQDMKLETELFVTENLWLREPYFASLFSSTDGWINSTIDTIYETNALFEDWQFENLETTRTGILTRSAFLTAHANSSSSSPVRRGAFILQELLCENLTPPADIDMVIPPASSETETIRDRLEQHQTDPSCAACHQRIDALGIGFENYGPIGEWRTAWENDIEINAGFSLDGENFTNGIDFSLWLAQSTKAQDCYVRQWYSYAMGRPINDSDEAAIDIISERFQNSNGNIRQLVIDITLMPGFRYHPVEVK